SWWRALVLGLLVGLVGFYLVEQPARRWLNANWIGGRPAPLPAQTV
ncbi:MAG: hypothetical protein JWP73_1382, partial [Phenylobacterium sp.]|nr:hypothetical protein [Phenylobacterium sp.]